MATTANPFPGMNPYLEWHWGDVHQSLVTYARDALNERLPAGLLARMEERVFVETEAYDRPVAPDVRVVQVRRPLGAGGTAVADAPGDVAASEPILIRFLHEPITEGYIVIRDAKASGQVVTLIEVLSEANKGGGRGEQEYKKKQNEMRDAGANLVEIDLLRAGRHVLSIPRSYVPPEHQAPYRVCVWRAAKPDQAEWYAASLRERLPVIRVPLRRSDTDVTLDLQALLDEAYRKGRYDYIDYGRPPEPPLAGDDAAWADELLKSKGLR